MRFLGSLFLVVLVPSFATGNVYIYPNRGQSAEQQSKDRYDCHTWAVQQTGFDPTRPPPTTAQAAPQEGGQIVRGAARGALVGTVGGAIAGDAGRGAAAGAAMGSLLGGMRRMEASRVHQQQLAQQQSYYAQQQADYNRAMGACLEGRGYTVR